MIYSNRQPIQRESASFAILLQLEADRYDEDGREEWEENDLNSLRRFACEVGPTWRREEQEITPAPDANNEREIRGPPRDDEV